LWPYERIFASMGCLTLFLKVSGMCYFTNFVVLH